jgi:CheY-like chemotaxis protein
VKRQALHSAHRVSTLLVSNAPYPEDPINFVIFVESRTNKPHGFVRASTMRLQRVKRITLFFTSLTVWFNRSVPVLMFWIGDRGFFPDEGAMGVLRILVADDNDSIRTVLREILQSEDDREVCGEAKNGEEAIRRARELSPDVILIDIM